MDKPFMVVFERPGLDDYYLRGTIFTAYLDRAADYATREEAQAAIEKARMFYPKRIFSKGVRIIDNRRDGD